MLKRCFTMIAVIASLQGDPSWAGPETIGFTFAPETGSEVAYWMKEARRYDIPGKRSVSLTEGTQTYVVEKAGQAGQAGAVIKVTFGKTRFEENGVEKEVPPVAAMQGKGARFVVGRDGRLKNIEGLAELSHGIQQEFENPRVREIVGKLFTEDKLRERLTAEWNSREGIFAGRTATVGHSWYGTQELDMPFLGVITIYRKSTLTALETIDGKASAHVMFSYFSDPVILAEPERKGFEDFRKGLAADIPNLGQQGILISGKGDTWIIPGSMLILRENRTITGAFVGLTTGERKDGLPETGQVELRWEMSGVSRGK